MAASPRDPRLAVEHAAPTRIKEAVKSWWEATYQGFPLPSLQQFNDTVSFMVMQNVLQDAVEVKL